MLNLLGAGAVRRQDRCAWLEGDVNRRRREGAFINRRRTHSDYCQYCLSLMFYMITYLE